MSTWFSFRLFLRCLQTCIINNPPGCSAGLLIYLFSARWVRRQLARAVPSVPPRSQSSAIASVCSVFTVGSHRAGAAAAGRGSSVGAAPLARVGRHHSAAKAAVVGMDFGVHLPERGACAACNGAGGQRGCPTQLAAWMDGRHERGALVHPQMSRGASVCTEV